MRLTLFSCCFFLFSHSYSQTSSNQEKINTLLQDYYLYEREVIHVQFNKISFINNEHLAFKGYVLNKNKNEPHQKTTNVQLVIYDAEQNVIQKQLLYTTKGSFAGGIQLNNTFKTGRYYFRFYTNWMNNFREDDTFTQSIEITDLNDTYHLKSQEPNWDTVKVSFFPEGGNIIDGITNSVGVKITDCNPKGI